MLRLAILALASATPAITTAATVPASSAVETKLTASDGVRDMYYGQSVGISGDVAIIGGTTDNYLGPSYGSAYLVNAMTGVEIVKLSASDGSLQDRFGHSVGVWGETAIVGAPTHGEAGNWNAGAAYLFDASTGQQVALLQPTDRAQGDYFGVSVAIAGDRAVVGANRDYDNGTFSGSAYLFDVATGAEIAKLTPEDGKAYDFFGSAVAVSQNVALVGASERTGVGVDAGVAYLFDANTGEQLAKLLPDDTASGQYFGNSVAVSDNIAVVGAVGDRQNGNGSGAVYLFDVTTGEQLAKLVAPDGASTYQFGSSVAISGDLLIVGATLDTVNGLYTGSAYVFDLTTGLVLGLLTANDGEQYDYFGASVAISGDTALVGAPRENSSGFATGAAYLYTGVSAPSPVPLPAGVWLLGAGLAALAISGRRRRGQTRTSTLCA